MPLQETSGAASYDGFGGGVAAVPNYIEDVFSTYLYTGTGATQTIINGNDLATYGGMVWSKSRSTADPAGIFDTARGATNSLRPSGTNVNIALSGVTSFNTNGFTLGSYPYFNGSGQNQVAWTFRKQPKFFDVVTYTGNGVSGRTISHSLGSVPGCIFVKQTSGADPWFVYHRSTGSGQAGQLNSTAAFSADSIWNYTDPTSTNFTVSSSTNTNGATFVAYVFAHNAGGFGLTGTDNVISCGSYTGGGASAVAVNLGYEVQWLFVRDTAGGNWYMFDNMRGAPNPSSTNTATLKAESSAAEVQESAGIFTATGFSATSGTTINSTGSTYIYIAIRRGPMKVPTSASDYFAPVTRVGNGGNPTISGGITDDVAMIFRRPGTTSTVVVSRLIGNPYLETVNANAQNTDTLAFPTNTWDVQQGLKLGGSRPIVNSSGINYIDYHWRRAPSFLDDVCWDGTGTQNAKAHNLTVAPELIIVKKRTQVGGQDGWWVYHKDLPTNYVLQVNSTSAKQDTSGYTYPFFSSVGASTFTVGDAGQVNASGEKYVARLWATCAGVSKVGSYNGTGATQTISCGFASGARFVLIKRTDASGDWFVWDTARGMVSGTDPSLLLNSTAAEVNANSIYTTTGGFQIVSTAAGINASGGNYIFLAIS